MGAIWRGTKGYGEPTSWKLTHYCRNQVADEYVQSVYTMRGRSEAQLVEAWNTRAPNPAADALAEAVAAYRATPGTIPAGARLDAALAAYKQATGGGE